MNTHRKEKRHARQHIIRDLGWSERHFASRFRTEFGLTPKVFARILRFDRAVRRLQAGAADMADLALVCGYYDQPHFNRDFLSFAGVSPVALLESRSADDPGFRA